MGPLGRKYDQPNSWFSGTLLALNCVLSGNAFFSRSEHCGGKEDDISSLFLIQLSGDQIARMGIDRMANKLFQETVIVAHEECLILTCIFLNVLLWSSCRINQRYDIVHNLGKC